MRFFSTLTFIVLISTLNAQTERGSLLLDLDGRMFSFAGQGKYHFYGDTKLTVGYAFFNDCFIGVQYAPIYYLHLGSKSSVTLYEYGLFGKYYFFGGKNKIFAMAAVNGTSFYETTSLRMDAAIGFARFLSSNAALDFRLDYNFYNRTKYHSLSWNPSAPPIDFDQNSPTGLGLTFSLKFFLPNNGLRDDGIRTPLVERYLKKGNRSIGLAGTGDKTYSRANYYGVFEKSRFLTDGFQLSHQLVGTVGIGDGYGLVAFQTYNAGIKPYLPLAKRTFFSPSISVGPIVWLSKVLKKDYALGWSSTGNLAFTHFLKSTKIEIGAYFTAQNLFDTNDEPYINGALFLSSEFFIAKQLAIKPVLQYNLLEQPTLLPEFRNEKQTYFRDMHLNFGFSYYY